MRPVVRSSHAIPHRTSALRQYRLSRAARPSPEFRGHWASTSVSFLLLYFPVHSENEETNVKRRTRGPHPAERGGAIEYYRISILQDQTPSPRGPSGLRHRFSEAKVSLWMCENDGRCATRGGTRTDSSATLLHAVSDFSQRERDVEECHRRVGRVGPEHRSSRRGRGEQRRPLRRRVGNMGACPPAPLDFGALRTCPLTATRDQPAAARRKKQRGDAKHELRKKILNVQPATRAATRSAGTLTIALYRWGENRGLQTRLSISLLRPLPNYGNLDDSQ